MKDDIYFKENKNSFRDEIKERVDEFIRRGGEIKKIEYGVSAESKEDFKNRVRMGIIYKGGQA